MSSNKPISADKIAALKAKPARTRSTTNTNPFEPRELATWWSLSHIMHFGDCENPECKDRRPHREQAGNTMVIDMPSAITSAEPHTMCRICFLDGYLSSTKW